MNKKVILIFLLPFLGLFALLLRPHIMDDRKLLFDIPEAIALDANAWENDTTNRSWAVRTIRMIRENEEISINEDFFKQIDFSLQYPDMVELAKSMHLIEYAVNNGADVPPHLVDRSHIRSKLNEFATQGMTEIPINRPNEFENEEDSGFKRLVANRGLVAGMGLVRLGVVSRSRP